MFLRAKRENVTPDPIRISQGGLPRGVLPEGHAEFVPQLEERKPVLRIRTAPNTQRPNTQRPQIPRTSGVLHGGGFTQLPKVFYQKRAISPTLNELSTDHTLLQARCRLACIRRRASNCCGGVPGRPHLTEVCVLRSASQSIELERH
eukprot:9491269-Pyramimonas_sp.AAC.1